MNPLISVILPVWNCPDYVGASIESILSQTFGNFELIIIDDGSTDGTPQVLNRYSDPRIRHHRHTNRGLAGTLNAGIGMARGDFIARQDQDDLSLPDRIERQMAYLDAHENCGLLGTHAQIIEGNRLSERFHRHPTGSHILRYELLFNNPFVHSSVMMRRSVLETVGGYSTDPERQPPEDYELWSRISRVAEVANLPEALLQYREIPTSMSRQGPSPFRERLIRICSENLAAACGEKPSDPEIHAMAALTHGAANLLAKAPDFKRMRRLLEQCAGGIFGTPAPRHIRMDIQSRIAGLRANWLVPRGPLARWVANPGPVREICKAIFNTLARKKSL